MLNLIVGKNSIGKSAALRGLASKCKNGIYNLKLPANYENVKLNKDALNWLVEDLGHETAVASDTSIYSFTNEEWSRKYITSIEMICKECSEFFLDEIENSMTDIEVSRLYKLIYLISQDRNVWIITHNKELLDYYDIGGVTLYTVRDSRLNKIEVSEVEQFYYTI